ncbi:MAG TPA: outer membrane beta-barrel protein [Ignavibacteriaceae bacterium]|nr:outer membrane beta-barrel protein [Ignavibacteriaceae bacterium]
MNLIPTSLLILIISFNNLYGQDFYFRINGGYGLGTSPQEFNSLSISADDNIFWVTMEPTEFSFGGGIYFSGALGYYISSNLGVEIDFNYVLSSELNLYKNSTGVALSDELHKEQISSKYLLIIPSFFLSFEINSIKPYMKIGPILGSPSIVTDGTSYFSPGSDEYHTRTVYDGGIALGVNTSLGITYNLNQVVGLNFEVSNRNISYSPEKGRLEEAVLNNQSVMDELSVHEKEFEFVDKAPLPGDSGIDKPSREPKVQYPFNSLVFSMGISFLF